MKIEILIALSQFHYDGINEEALTKLHAYGLTGKQGCMIAIIF